MALPTTSLLGIPFNPFLEIVQTDDFRLSAVTLPSNVVRHNATVNYFSAASKMSPLCFLSTKLP